MIARDSQRKTPRRCDGSTGRWRICPRNFLCHLAGNDPAPGAGPDLFLRTLAGSYPANRTFAGGSADGIHRPRGQMTFRESEVAERLGLGRSTADSHSKSVLPKLAIAGGESIPLCLDGLTGDRLLWPIALKTLISDRGKPPMLLVGVVFSIVLVKVQVGTVCGSRSARPACWWATARPRYGSAISGCTTLTFRIQSPVVGRSHPHGSRRAGRSPT